MCLVRQNRHYPLRDHRQGSSTELLLLWDGNDVEQRWPIPDRAGKKVHTLNSDVYLVQLDRLHEAIQAKRPRKNNHIVFHHDNAKPHVEAWVVDSIDDKGWDLLPHPPYSPTEAPSDYHVNRSLKKPDVEQGL